MTEQDRKSDLLDERARAEREYDRQVERVVAAIHAVADRVLIESRPVRGLSPFGVGFANTIHSIQWGMANVPLESLGRAAVDADRVAADLALRGSE